MGCCRFPPSSVLFPRLFPSPHPQQPSSQPQPQLHSLVTLLTCPCWARTHSLSHLGKPLPDSGFQFPHLYNQKGQGSRTSHHSSLSPSSINGARID